MKKVGFKYKIRKFLGWTNNYPISFYILDFLFRRIIGQNRDVPWPVHFTSTIHCANNIVKGSNTFPGDSPGVYINAFNGVNIGDNTNLGPRVSLISGNHDFAENDLPPVFADPIIIGANCWLGANSCVLPGVQLGDFTIVAAGAVVSASFPQGNVIIGGVPAKIIKHLDPITHQPL